MTPFVNILIGTRGQFVKMAPVLREFDKRNIAYRIIHTGQHTASTQEMAAVFGVRHGDVFLTRRTSDITSIKDALLWFCLCFMKGIRQSPLDRSCAANAIMVHGDTMSTLIGCLLSFFWGQRLVHVESGLTTGTLWTPFPEEIIRRICMAGAHVLYAPGDWAAANCARRARRTKRGSVVCTAANTVLDSVRYVMERKQLKNETAPYGVVTLHRNETFYSRAAATAAIETVTGIGDTWRLLFVMHRLTERRLKKYGLFEVLLKNETMEILGYQRYDEFMSLVSHASFVITDGGGLQEETYYLNVPCLVLRRKTERLEGIGSSAVISGSNACEVKGFFESLSSPRHLQPRDFSSLHPSATIVDHMLHAFSTGPDEREN
jgi:UDP-N-acetylglucosamine 2-epimerase (non-hydrolysing)